MAGGFSTSAAASAKSSKAQVSHSAGGPYNILMIVTDQERHLTPEELPAGYRLPVTNG